MFRPCESQEELIKAKMYLSCCNKEMIFHVYQGLLKYHNQTGAIKMTCELMQVSNITVWRIIE